MVRDIQEMDRDTDNHSINHLIVQSSGSLSKRNQLIRQNAFDVPDEMITRKKTTKDDNNNKDKDKAPP